MSLSLMSYDELPLVKFICEEFTRGTGCSYGLIIYCRSTKRWYMVKRKHAHQILNLFWGKFYPVEIPDFVFSLDEESVNILTRSLVSLDAFEKEYRSISDTGNKSNIQENYNKLIKHKKLIQRSIEKRQPVVFNQLCWLWAKGQQDNTDQNCLKTAIREFLEESGLDTLPKSTILPDKITINVVYRNRTYIDTFWVCVLEEEFDAITPLPEEIEISDRGWFTIEETKNKIRQSHISTIEIAARLVSGL